MVPTITQMGRGLLRPPADLFEATEQFQSCHSSDRQTRRNVVTSAMPTHRQCPSPEGRHLWGTTTFVVMATEY
jgi:hypothetical protein